MVDENPMRKIRIERVVLNVGGTGDKLERGIILLGKLSGKKPTRRKATKRIPTWGVRPNLEVGAMVTLRNEDAEKMILKVLPAIDNTIKARQLQKNFLSFGIKEYIEIPSFEYIREVGMMGFEITIVFTRPGRRVALKKTKTGKFGKKQTVKPEEIEEFMKNKFKTKFTGRKG